MMELNIEIQPPKGEKTATTTFLKVKEKKSALSERQAKKKKKKKPLALLSGGPCYVIKYIPNTVWSIH